MANEQNLTGNHKLTAEELSRGGKRSAESRRRKKTMREAMRTLLEGNYDNKETGKSYSGYEALCMQLMRVAMNTDDDRSVYAFRTIMSLMGEDKLPPEQDNVSIDKLDQILAELKQKAVDEQSK